MRGLGGLLAAGLLLAGAAMLPAPATGAGPGDAASSARIASLKAEPPKDAWDFLDTLISSRNAVCEAAIRKADVAAKVRELAGRAFTVRVPTGFVRPMSLPAAFRDTVDVRGRRAGLAITPAGVTITKTRIWYGANVAVKARGDAAGPRRASP